MKNDSIDCNFFVKIVLNCRDNIGQAILHTAVDSCNLSAVKSLIEIGIAEKLINVQDNHNMTAMHIASINYEEPIFSLLIQLKPNKELKDEDDKTFIDYLQENEDLEDFEKLLKFF